MARTERDLTPEETTRVRDRDDVVVVPDTNDTDHTHDSDTTHRDHDRVVLEKSEARDEVARDPEFRRRIVQEEMVRHGVIQPRQLGNAPATAGLTLGLAACAVGWVPALFPVAAVFGVVGLLLSITGKKRAHHEERTGSKRAAAGMLFSLIGIALAVVGLLVVADVINTFDGTIADVWDQMKDIDTDLSDSLG